MKFKESIRLEGMKPLPQSLLKIAKVEAFVYRAPIDVSVRTSFGVMHERPAVFVRVTDVDGAVGWGEVWCNFPACGGEHRARLVETLLRPMVLARSFSGPAEVYTELSRRTAVLAIQSGEQGPIAQAIAGVDLALWDLCARRAHQPLWRYLGGQTGAVKVYASGINPNRPEDTIALCQSQGHTAFKLKIGFGHEQDLANLACIRKQFGNDYALMADANQAWSLEEACAITPQLTQFNLGWLEEPLRADRPLHEWHSLANVCVTPLAAGENIMGEGPFQAVLDNSPLSVVQPDIAKWGGISACWLVIQAIRAKGKLYCPHYLGAGVGLLASAHVLAAAGGDGMLEIDSNVNPLRSRLAGPLTTIINGGAQLDEGHGLGIAIDFHQSIEQFKVAH